MLATIMTVKERLKDGLRWNSSRMLWVVGALVLLVVMLIITIGTTAVA